MPPPGFRRHELDDYLKMVEEAKRRDHRVLGKQLELFATSPLVGAGLVLWLPKGAIIRGLLESFVREELTRRGYQPVYTPNIGKVELYQISGHFPYYADSQFKPIVMSDDERYLLKPMNCPHHIKIYKSKPRSYRDLPVRLAEFGTVYRYEQSGELSGMTRVRGFTQDDAHLFCTEEQVGDEFRGCIEMTQFVLAALGMNGLSRAAGLSRSQERQVRRQRRDLATGRGGTRDCLPRHRLAALGIEPRRGGVLRSQGRLRGLATASAASGNWAPCSSITTCRAPTLRARIRRGRQPAASSGDDPPRAVRLAGTIRGRADRALRRRVPALAVARSRCAC